jgi:DMSO/TMAO reductase YedYZ molybdopterin-dependent catalytic subunit
MRKLGLFLAVLMVVFIFSCSRAQSTSRANVEPSRATAGTETTSAPASEPSPVSPSSPAAPSTLPVTPSLQPTPKSPTDLMNYDPSQIDNSGMPITPIEALGVTAHPPDIDISTYILTVDGLVNRPLSIDYNTLLQEPTITKAVLLICPGSFSGNCEWTGVRMSTLLNEAGVQPEANQVTVFAIDGDNQTFGLADVEKEGVFLAYAVDGQTLPKEHGYPVRLVVEGKYGVFWVKWVNRVEVK